MKKTVKILALVLALCMLLTFAACGNTSKDSETQPEVRIVKDMTGAEVEIPYNVEKIAIATPVHTIFAMVSGSADKLVTWPLTPNELSLTLFPDSQTMNEANPFTGKDANLEPLLELDPDVVVLAIGSSYIEAVEEMGFPVVQIDHSDFDTLMTSILTIAEVAGEENYEKAEEYVAYFRKNQATIESKVSSLTDDQKQHVAYIWGADGDEIYSYGNDTVQQALIEAAGGIDSFTFDSYQVVTLEDILNTQIDSIICSRKVDYDAILSSAEWATVPAVKAGNVYCAPKGMNGMIAVAPEIAMGLLWTAKSIYPDLFSDVDVESEITYFYKTFLNYDLSAEQLQKIMNAEY